MTNNLGPAVLRTCTERRNVGLKYYSLEFGCEGGIHFRVGESAKRLLLNVKIPPSIYVNWEVDTICFIQMQQDQPDIIFEHQIRHWLNRENTVNKLN